MTAAPPAQNARAALQEADDEIRSEFKNAVSMNPATVGGMPCDRACWALEHLEKDDTGAIPEAYEAASAAYRDQNQSVPAEVAQWKTSVERVLADIQVWDMSVDMTGGVAKRSALAKSQVLVELDKADALVGQIAPASTLPASNS